jgi:hypothetical protein
VWRAQSEEALLDFTAAVELAPSLSETHMNRGMHYHSMGDFMCVTCAHMCLPRARTRGSGLHEHVVAASLCRAARDDWMRAISIDPTVSYAWNWKAQAELSMGVLNDATNSLLQAVQFHPKARHVELVVPRAVSWARQLCTASLCACVAPCVRACVCVRADVFVLMCVRADVCACPHACVMRWRSTRRRTSASAKRGSSWVTGRARCRTTSRPSR